MHYLYITNDQFVNLLSHIWEWVTKVGKTRLSVFSRFMSHKCTETPPPSTQYAPGYKCNICSFILGYGTLLSSHNHSVHQGTYEIDIASLCIHLSLKNMQPPSIESLLKNIYYPILSLNTKDYQFLQNMLSTIFCLCLELNLIFRFSP